ncbi:DUF1428 domain-containing protein [Patescibacteria group bacterium]|jgi:uncharacterized protein YbaA (DUF1428 family)|nr:DUF1428 domain-containing protein [Patescibacteria group bacterium]
MSKSKANYVDGFLIVVPKKNLAAYKRMATGGMKMWKKYGALDYKECVGDDLKVAGVVATFPKVLKLKPSETVIFSYITYKSKADRNRINAKVMNDPSMDPNMKMPFDMKRMSVGGFKILVDG